MDFTNVFSEMLKISPIAGVMLWWVYKMYNDARADRAETMRMQKEYNDSMLQLQRDSITAQNNYAEAQRTLATSITALGSTQEELLAELRGQPRTRRIGTTSRQTA